MMTPRSGTGANTAERVPSTMRAWPLKALAPAGSRSWSVSPECSTATRHGEALAEAADELRREADLRHQHQRPPAAREHALHDMQIDLGLAAAGDAVQNKRGEVAEGGVNGFHRGALFRAQYRS